MNKNEKVQVKWAFEYIKILNPKNRPSHCH